MNVGDGFGAEAVAEGVFEGGGEGVGGLDGHVGRDADVEVDDSGVANTAGAEVVGGVEAGDGAGKGKDFGVDLGGHATVGEGIDLAADDVPREFEEEGADEEGGNGVEDAPFVAEEGGGADAEGGGDGGEGVGTVVPGVGDENRAAGAAADADRGPVEPFLDRDGDERGPEGNGAGRGKGFAAKGVEDGVERGGTGLESDERERGADEEGDERGVLAVAVSVVGVGRTRGEAESEQHREVRDEIGERVQRVRDKRLAASEDANGEFRHHEHEVDADGKPRDADAGLEGRGHLNHHLTMKTVFLGGARVVKET